ncbi:MAG: HPF/RaiA family ribosome-associated protein [Gammaproteobacteria bacterium]|nr:HPF/RaiA family ribosome-associated protein [Gammaproteobacteria bacterium]
MQINIYAHGFTTTEALREHVTRRLHHALGGCADHISQARVRLSDVNGPRGGADKCCQIQVRLAHLADVVIENTEADLYVAIDRAAERVGRTAARHIARQRRPVRISSRQETASNLLMEG